MQDKFYIMLPSFENRITFNSSPNSLAVSAGSCQVNISPTCFNKLRSTKSVTIFFTYLCKFIGSCFHLLLFCPHLGSWPNVSASNILLDLRVLVMVTEWFLSSAKTEAICVVWPGVILPATQCKTLILVSLKLTMNCSRFKERQVHFSIKSISGIYNSNSDNY